MLGKSSPVVRGRMRRVLSRALPWRGCRGALDDRNKAENPFRGTSGYLEVAISGSNRKWFFAQNITHITTTIAGYIRNQMHRLVKRPDRCICCGHDMVHRHGHYERFLVHDGKPHMIAVARFLCPCCRRTTSLLPSFALPYRLLPASMVQSWFEGDHSHVGSAQYESLQKDYRRHWERRCGALHAMLGGALGRMDPGGLPQQLYRALIGQWGDLAGANAGLLRDFGQSLLGTYRIHDWARVARSAVDGLLGPRWPDTS